MFMLAQADPSGSLPLQFGMAGAVLLVVGLFLHHLREERKDRAEERKDRAAERESFIATIKAIGEDFAETSRRQAASLEKLTLRIEHCPQRKTNGIRQGGE